MGNPILGQFAKKYRWENLLEYYKDPKFKLLDKIFSNPNSMNKEEREKVLSSLDINQEQKDFLLSIYDIDWLIIENNRPFLLEEKSTSKFYQGNYIYLSCGTNTQAKNLEKAKELGIKAGVLVNFVKWGKMSVESNFLNQKDAKILFSKIYLFGINANATGGKNPTIRIPINENIKKLK